MARRAAPAPRTPLSLFLRFLRVWLPVAVVLAGLIVIAVDPTIDGLEGAAHIIGAGLAIWLLNLLVRIGISGDRERNDEVAAREFYARHGHWPDEPPPSRPAPAPTPRPAHRRAPPSRPAHGAGARRRGPR